MLPGNKNTTYNTCPWILLLTIFFLVVGLACIFNFWLPLYYTTTNFLGAKSSYKRKVQCRVALGPQWTKTRKKNSNFKYLFAWLHNFLRLKSMLFKKISSLQVSPSGIDCPNVSKKRHNTKRHKKTHICFSAYLSAVCLQFW